MTVPVSLQADIPLPHNYHMADKMPLSLLSPLSLSEPEYKQLNFLGGELLPSLTVPSGAGLAQCFVLPDSLLIINIWLRF